MSRISVILMVYYFLDMLIWKTQINNWGNLQDFWHSYWFPLESINRNKKLSTFHVDLLWKMDSFSDSQNGEEHCFKGQCWEHEMPGGILFCPRKWLPNSVLSTMEMVSGLLWNSIITLNFMKLMGRCPNGKSSTALLSFPSSKSSGWPTSPPRRRQGRNIATSRLKGPQGSSSSTPPPQCRKFTTIFPPLPWWPLL